MAEKDDFEDEKQGGSTAQAILDAAAKEMGFAVDSIRHEVIEKGWFGKDAGLTPDVAGDWLRDEQPDPDTSPEPPNKAFSWDDLYGRDLSTEGERDELGQERDLDQDFER